MVVAGFQGYVEREIPGALYPANLKELIKEKLTHVSQPPTVVLDTSALLKNCKESTFDYFQPRRLKECVEMFVRSIISAGARLIVVVRGTFEKDINRWNLKKKNYFFKIIEKFEDFDSIYTGESIISCQFPFSSIKSNNYKVFKSIDCVHKEVAKLATELNCLAVIGQDSNYLIYEGIRNYILTASLNLKTLDCSIYDRNKVIEHLGLKSHDMPLFGTLCGNDIVNIVYLYDFQKKITLLNKNKFLQIAKKVKHWKGRSYDHIKDVVNEVSHFKVNESLIKESLDMYLNFESTPSKNKWLLFANELKKNFKWCNGLYELFILKEFRSGKYVFITKDFKFIESLRPLRRKIYGILFFEDENKTVAEYFPEREKNHNFITPTYVDAIEPECEHPGLMQLFDDKTPNVEYMRWNLFLDTISKTISHATIRNLPPTLAFQALIFHYIVNETEGVFLKKIFTHQFEIEAFLIVAVLTHANADCAELRNSQKLKRPHFRPFILSIVYLEVYYTLKLLNEACGVVFSSESSSLYNFFDELLFHSVYEKMRGGTKWEEFFGGDILLEVLFTTLVHIVFN